MYGMMQGGMLFGGAIMWIFWILIAVVLFVLVKAAFGRSSTGNDSESSAVEILDRRYARGEIDEREYRARRRELER